jgi:hypothetical protein
MADMRKLGFVGAIVVAAAFAFAALSPGASASEPGGGGGGGLPFSAIPGILDAHGDGIMAGAGMLDMRLCADDGLLLIKKGDAQVKGGMFTGEADWMGLHVYFGFHDCMYLTGGKTAALLVGTGLKLYARGVGYAFLKGTGGYTSDGVPHDGSTEGIVVRIGQNLETKPSTTPQPGHTEQPHPTRTPGTGDHHEPTRTPTTGPV